MTLGLREPPWERPVWNPNESDLERLVYGGAVLGGGGGGSIEAGMQSGRRALAAGTPRINELSEMPDKARVVTLSRVGAVGRTSGNGDQFEGQFARALDLLVRTSATRVAGLIPSEIGPPAVTYGSEESAKTGLPILDAPCNGRAHPLGLMGSLGLHSRPSYITHTVAIGGKRETANYVELAVKSNAQRAAQVVRNAAARSTAGLAVVRNPLPAYYVRRHAAVGGLKYAHRVGEEFIRHRNAGIKVILRALSRLMGGSATAAGTVVSTDLTEQSGFTLGSIGVRLITGDLLCLPVCNEFMWVVRRGTPLATFPDLITLFHNGSTLPLNSTQVRVGSQVTVFVVPHRHLRLGSPMKDRKLLSAVQGLFSEKVREQTAPRRETESSYAQ